MPAVEQALRFAAELLFCVKSAFNHCEMRSLLSG